MKRFKAWVSVVAVVGIGAGLVVFYLPTTKLIDRNPSANSAGDDNSEGTGRPQSVFTLFKSPWQLPEFRFINRKNREITLAWVTWLVHLNGIALILPGNSEATYQIKIGLYPDKRYKFAPISEPAENPESTKSLPGTVGSLFGLAA